MSEAACHCDLTVILPSREAIVAEEMALFEAGGGIALPSVEFSVESITVWHTPRGDSSCRQWRKVAEIPLQS